MAHQPTFPYPYLTTIDAENGDGIDFKCLINPRDTITKYKINVYSAINNKQVLYVRGEAPKYIESAQLYSNLSKNNYIYLYRTLTGISEGNIEKYIGMYVKYKGELRKIIEANDVNATYIQLTLTSPFSNAFEEKGVCDIYDACRKYLNLTPDDSTNEVEILEDEFSFTDSTLPLQGNDSDNSWLVVNVPYEISSSESDDNYISTGLLNGIDYKWNIELWGVSPDVQIETSTINKFTSLNITANGELTSTKAGMFIKYKNELREIVKVNLNDDGNTTLTLSSDFSNELLVNDWFYILDKKVTSFDYFFKARFLPNVDINSIISDEITSNELSFEIENLYANYDFVITGDNLSTYFEEDSGEYYFEWDKNNSYFKASNIGTPSTTAITKLTAKKDLFNLSFKSYVRTDSGGTSDELTITVINSPVFTSKSVSGYYWKGNILKGQDIIFEYKKDSNEGTIYTENAYFSDMNGALVDNTSSSITPIEFYKVDLYLDNELIHTSNEVYSTFVKYKYGGLISDNEYTVKLTLGIGNNETITYSKTFDVNYKKHNAIINPIATDDKKKGCVKIDFSKNSSIKGNLEGYSDELTYTKFKNGASADIPEDNNAISLNTYQSIYWDNFNENPLNLNNTTQLIHWHGHPGFNDYIFKKTDNSDVRKNITVGYNGEYFYYIVGINESVRYSPILNKYYSYPYSGYDDDMNEIILTAVSDDSEINKGYYYVLSDETNLEDNAELLCNDMAYNYWWLIVVKDDEVQFIKTNIYADTIVEN